MKNNSNNTNNSNNSNNTINSNNSKIYNNTIEYNNDNNIYNNNINNNLINNKHKNIIYYNEYLLAKEKKTHNQLSHKKYCTNCYCINTPLWRKNVDGYYVCNACGLYYKFNKKTKPVSQERKKENYLKAKKKILEDMVVELLVQIKAYHTKYL
ncbi:gata4 [Ecytonucleospora hepatopenaei]|uniref:Gata4 n=1 Tax=Ecytonucleospora hepatopenaei TaxID=646526 RepID=A0A1W0E991_9MICR|nr:gata4 [Ecytonucleospora hepatopenaei]